VWSFVWGTTAKKRAVVFGKISGFEKYSKYHQNLYDIRSIQRKIRSTQLLFGRNLYMFAITDRKRGRREKSKFFGCLRVAAPLKIF
jgi:hypothetical protein